MRFSDELSSQCNSAFDHDIDVCQDVRHDSELEESAVVCEANLCLNGCIYDIYDIRGYQRYKQDSHDCCICIGGDDCPMTDLVPFLVNTDMLTQDYKFSCLADTATCMA